MLLKSTDVGIGGGFPAVRVYDVTCNIPGVLCFPNVCWILPDVWFLFTLPQNFL